MSEHPTPPTAEEIEALRALMEKATPGPWRSDFHYVTPDYDEPGGVSFETVAKSREPWFHPDAPDQPTLIGYTDSPSMTEDGNDAKANCALIVAAVNSLPALLAAAEERQRLAEENAELKERLGRPTFQCSDCGSTGPFRDVVYPNTPNGPEEYDMECEECHSLRIDESPRCAFSSMQNRMDTKLAEAETAIGEMLQAFDGTDVALQARTMDSLRRFLAGAGEAKP